MNQKNACYIVLGMHRSGTSLVAGVLSKIGVFLGDKNNLLLQTVENPLGYFENNEVVLINDDILKFFGGTWDSIPTLQYGWHRDARLTSIRERIASFVESMESRHAPWGIKDPRMGITLPLWQEYLPEDTCYIITHRNPIEVIQSLQKRNNDIAVQNFFSLWSQTYKSIQKYTHTKPCIYTSYHLLHESFKNEVERIIQQDPFYLLAQVYEEKKDTVHTLFDAQLRRNFGMNGYHITSYQMNDIDFWGTLSSDAFVLHHWLTEDFEQQKKSHLTRIAFLEDQNNEIQKRKEGIQLVQENIQNIKQDIIEKIQLGQYSQESMQQSLLQRLEKIEKNYREKTFALVQLLEKKQQKESELQSLIYEKDRQIDIGTTEKEFLHQSIIEKEQHIVSLQSHVQSMQVALQSTQQLLQQKEIELQQAQKEDIFSYVKNIYQRARWAVLHPLRFIKKWVWSKIPTYPEIRWAILHPLRFSKKYIWKKIPTYPQIIWALHHPRKFFHKYAPLAAQRFLKGLDPHPLFFKDIASHEIVVVLHLYYVDMWDEMTVWLKRMPFSYTLVVSLVEGNFTEKERKRISSFSENVKIIIVKNKGLDVLPFLKSLMILEKTPRFVLKIQPKKVPHTPSVARAWFADLMNHVLPKNSRDIDMILHNLEYSDVGMIGGSEIDGVNRTFTHNLDDHTNEPAIDRHIMQKLFNYFQDVDTEYSWISGTIFWTKFEFLEKFCNQEFIDFFEKNQSEGYFKNDTLAHAMERYFGKAIYDNGKYISRYPKKRFSCDYIHDYIPKNITLSSVIPQKPIVAFFHVACMNNYIDVTEEIIFSLVSSGVYQNATKIFYGTVGTPDQEFLKIMQRYPKMECVYSHKDISLVEYPMLIYMQNYIKDQDIYVLYLHTKGVSKPHDTLTQEWRKYLLRHVVYHYAQHMYFLNHGCDISGTGWKEHPVHYHTAYGLGYSIGTHSHFSGNFWWASSSYLQSLPDIDFLKQNALRDFSLDKSIDFFYYRIICEMWIGMSKNQIHIGISGKYNHEFSISIPPLIIPRKPLILFVSHDNSMTGAPRVLFEIAQAIYNEGNYDVLVVSSDVEDQNPNFSQAGLNKIDRGYTMPVIYMNTYNEGNIDKIIALYNPSLLYINTVTMLSWALYAEFNRIPYVFHILEQEHVMRSVLGDRFYELNKLNSQSIVAISSAGIKTLHDVGVEDKMHLLFPFINTDTMQKNTSINKKQKKYIGTVGSISYRKGTDIFFETANKIPEKSFMCVGGLYDPDIVSILKHDNLTIINQTPDPFLYMNQFELFALPSREEPFGLVLLEAVYLGIPIIAFQKGLGSFELFQYLGDVLPGEANVEDLYAYIKKDTYLKKNTLSIIDQKKAIIDKHYSLSAQLPVLRHLIQNKIESHQNNFDDDFNNGHVLEIGGPSEVFSSIVPIYQKINMIDQINFSEKTLWQDEARIAETYVDPHKLGVSYIAEGTDLNILTDDTYDGILASHCLEHIANPIKAILEWKRVVRSGGNMIIIVPNKKECFDHKRPDTTFGHILGDYLKDTQEDDKTHFEEIFELHDIDLDYGVKDLEGFKTRTYQNKKYRAIHHHVFSPLLLREIASFCGLYVDSIEVHGIHIVMRVRIVK